MKGLAAMLAKKMPAPGKDDEPDMEVDIEPAEGDGEAGPDEGATASDESAMDDLMAAIEQGDKGAGLSALKDIIRNCVRDELKDEY